MVGKFNYRYGIYEMRADVPLYLRRAWNGQITAAEEWKHLYAVEYKYHVYVTKKYHIFFRDFWNRLSAYRGITKCENFNKSRYQSYVSLEEFVLESEMDEDVLEKGKQYSKDMAWQIVYEGIIEKLCFPIKYRGQM